MCDCSAKLVAWIDGELADVEAAEVDRHVQSCPECQSRIEAYENVSRLVGAYCNAVTTEPKPRHKLSGLLPVLSGAAVAAVLLLFMFRRPSVEQILVKAPAAKASPALVLETAKTSLAKEKIRKVHRRHATASSKSSKPDWAFGPAIQIAIPAESMFPPGAVPEGITFIADLSMSSDGSVQGLRLQQ